MKQTTAILFVLAFCLAGCSAQSESTALPAVPSATLPPVPVVTATRPTPGISLDDLHATLTAMPAPTETIAAPIITATPSPTQTPTLRPLEEGECFLDCDLNDCRRGDYRFSPDGKWTYQYCYIPGMGQGVTVFRMDQDLLWNIYGPKLGLRDYSNGEGVYEDIDFERWSSDGSAIYISTFLTGDPGPAHLYNANRLYAFHLDTGVAELIYQNGYFQFLGGDSNLFTVDTYFDRLSTTITIHHLDDGTDTLFHLPRGYYIPGSQVVWSPDYTRLLVSTGYSETFYGDSGPFGFMYFDFSTGEARIVMENQEAISWGDWASPIQKGTWLDGDIISILGSDDNQYYLDLNTNQFVSAPPTTSTPQP